MPSYQKQFDLVKERLTANRRLLLAAKDSDRVQAIAEQQKLVFVKAVKMLPKLSATDEATLVEEVVTVGWTGIEEVLKAITEKGDHADASEGCTLFQTNTKAQDFTTVEHFLPAELWNVDKSVFVQRVSEFVVTGLGCNTPSAFTARKIAAMGFIVIDGREKASVASYQTRKAAVDLVKLEMKKYKKVLPIEWIAELPSSPAELKSKYPLQYKHAYKHYEPAASPLANFDCMLVDSQLPCRNSALRLAQHGMAPNLLRPQVQSLQQSSSSNGFGQCGQDAVLQCLQTIAQGQLRMQQTMLAGQAHSQNPSQEHGVDLPGFRFSSPKRKPLGHQLSVSTPQQRQKTGGSQFPSLQTPPPLTNGAMVASAAGAVAGPTVTEATVGGLGNAVGEATKTDDAAVEAASRPSVRATSLKKKSVEAASTELMKLMDGGGCGKKPTAKAAAKSKVIANKNTTCV
jgi:hypothetical protein